MLCVTLRLGLIDLGPEGPFFAKLRLGRLANMDSLPVLKMSQAHSMLKGYYSTSSGPLDPHSAGQ